MDRSIVTVGEQSQRAHRIFVALLFDLRQEFFLCHLALYDICVTACPSVDGTTTDVFGSLVTKFKTLFPDFFESLAEERLVERTVGEVLRVKLRVTCDERLLFIISHLACMGDEVVIGGTESRPIQPLLHKIQPLWREECEFHEKLFRDVCQHIGRVGGKRVTARRQTTEDGAALCAINVDFEVIFAQGLHDARHTLCPFEHENVVAPMKRLSSFCGSIATLHLHLKEIIDISIDQIASTLDITDEIYVTTGLFPHLFHLFQVQRAPAMGISDSHHLIQTVEFI